MFIKIHPLLLVSIAAFGLSACNEPQTSAGEPTSSQARSSTQLSDPEAVRSLILAAAESFETLAEQAPGASSQTLPTLIAAARTSALGMSASLTDEQRGALDRRLAEIAAANANEDRIGIALASTEGYRTLIESAADTGKVPRVVGLLDYAGFRFQANLAAQPARWADAKAALDFADEQWAELEAHIRDQPLRTEFAQSLQQMRAAAQANDTAQATHAVLRELELVDGLEDYFNSLP